MPDAEFDPVPLLETLARHEVDFIVIGGVAGSALGSSYNTQDLDVAYARDDENLERITKALRELDARLRGAPADLPFQLDARTLKAGANFTFETRHGPFDILADPAGAPPYRVLKERSTKLEIGGFPVFVASIDDLIAMKRASARPKDQAMEKEYILLAEQLHRPERS